MVSNIGTADLEVTKTELDASDDFVIDSGGVIGGTPLKLAPGAIHNITVTFTPTITDPQSATLIITSNDPDQPIVKIPLEGTGVLVAPAIAVFPDPPDPLDYESVNINSRRSRILRVSNRGTANLAVTETTLSGNDRGQFTIDEGGAFFTVSPGITHFVEVSFIPTTEGPKNASLDITSNDPDPDLSVELRGIGSIQIPIKKP